MPRARSIGDRVAVYPWIGCGTCAACRAGEENMCSAHHHLGISADGGFASHVLIPHPRYLIDYEPLSAGDRGPADVLRPDRLRRAEASRRAGRPRPGAARRPRRGRHDGPRHRARLVSPAADRRRHRRAETRRGARGRRGRRLRPIRPAGTAGDHGGDRRRVGGLRLRRLRSLAAILPPACSRAAARWW